MTVAATFDIDAVIRANKGLVGYCFKRLARKYPAMSYDDALSEGLIALWKAVTEYDPGRGDLNQHLYNRVMYALRRLAGRHARQAEVSLTADVSGREDEVRSLRRHREREAQADLAAEVRGRLAGLPARTRRVLEMRGEGMTVEQIQGALAMGQREVRRRIADGRQALTGLEC